MSPVPAFRRQTLYTVTVNEQLTVRPSESVAVAVTVVTPGGNTEPDGGVTVRLVRQGLTTTGGGKFTTMPLAPRFGVPTTILAGHVMSGAGLETVTEAENELLLDFGSGVCEVSVTELVTIAPSASEQLAVATTVMSAEAPEASELKLTVRLFPIPPQTPPAVDPQETNVVPAGKLSLTTVLTAVSGPLFCSVMW